MEIFIALIILGLLMFKNYKKILRWLRPKYRQPWEFQPQSQTKHQANYQNNHYEQYTRRNFLSEHEFFAWKRLMEFATQNGLIICAKVRLLDLIEPKFKPTQKHDYALYRIQAKHVDFVICNQNMNVVAVIELDDNSHNEPDRIERDIFVNQVLKNTGYKLIRTRNITNEDLRLLTTIIPGTYWNNQHANTREQQSAEPTTEPEQQKDRDTGAGDRQSSEPATAPEQ